MEIRNTSRLDDSDSDTVDDTLSHTAEGTKLNLEPGSKGETNDENGVKLLMQKKRSAKRRFGEEDLLGAAGMDRVYGTFPKKCKFRGRGFEVFLLS